MLQLLLKYEGRLSKSGFNMYLSVFLFILLFVYFEKMFLCLRKIRVYFYISVEVMVVYLVVRRPTERKKKKFIKY